MVGVASPGGSASSPDRGSNPGQDRSLTLRAILRNDRSWNQNENCWPSPTIRPSRPMRPRKLPLWIRTNNRSISVRSLPPATRWFIFNHRFDQGTGRRCARGNPRQINSAIPAIRPQQAFAVGLSCVLIPCGHMAGETLEIPGQGALPSSALESSFRRTEDARAHSRQKPETAEGHSFPGGKQAGLWLRQPQSQSGELGGDPIVQIGPFLAVKPRQRPHRLQTGTHPLLIELALERRSGIWIECGKRRQHPRGGIDSILFDEPPNIRHTGFDFLAIHNAKVILVFAHMQREYPGHHRLHRHLKSRLKKENVPALHRHGGYGRTTRGCWKAIARRGEHRRPPH